MSKFANVTVGTAVGVRSTNHNAMHHYAYRYASVLEVTDDQFKVTTYGWFPKDTARRGSNEVVTKQEYDDNNKHWYAAQAANRAEERIKSLLQDMGRMPEDAAILQAVVRLLEPRVKVLEEDRAKARAQELAEATAEPATLDE